MKKALITISVFVIALMLQAASVLAAPSIDALLRKQINSSPLKLTSVIITYNHQPTKTDFAVLKSLGIKSGVYLEQLPMVLTGINQAQFNALAARSDIVSLYANRQMRLFDDKTRPFIGVSALRMDDETTDRNHNMPVTGKNIGVAYVDTGIDATHPDLQLGKNVVQNVFFPLAEFNLEFLPVSVNPDFFPVNPYSSPVLAIENAPLSDVQGGHGTFGAGITAGTGQASSGFYGGIAPGAKLVGLVAGNDVGLTTFAILQAYNAAIGYQVRYNIRVCNNSWGTTLEDVPYDPLDPINVATLTLHDYNITVVFAAGNDGDAPKMINPYSIAPWVISVAAADKEGYGNPASFSSRGDDNGTGSDVAGPSWREGLPAPNVRPDITGSGTNIKSTRSKAPGLTNLAGTAPIISNDATTIPAALLPYYTTSQGTSFSTPQVTGVVALMLEANPNLKPDDVVTILRQTATPMPYEQRVVGAGYVDAHNAVRVAMGLPMVAHPANLMKQPGDAEIIDPANDHGSGTTGAQDVISGDFSYDPATRQVVYTMTFADLSQRRAGNYWYMGSNYSVPDPTTPGSRKTVTLFVAALNDETGELLYTFGQISTLPNGTKNQGSVEDANGDRVPVDSGEIVGNQLIIKVSIDKINAALGVDADGNPLNNVLGMTSTGVSVAAQVEAGSSFTGGLLLTADEGTGTDFTVEP